MLVELWNTQSDFKDSKMNKYTTRITSIKGKSDVDYGDD